jgi:hypothetical protein
MTAPNGLTDAIEALFAAPHKTPAGVHPLTPAEPAPSGREGSPEDPGGPKPRRNRKSAKSAGTRAETAIANLLREAGFIYAERRAKTGAKDTGDISGLIGGVIEVKDVAKMALGTWLKEAKTEQSNAGAWWSAVWHKRVGKGSPADWYVTLDGASFIELLKAVYDIKADEAGAP